jgi:hypothetical protein
MIIIYYQYGKVSRGKIFGEWKTFLGPMGFLRNGAA